MSDCAHCDEIKEVCDALDRARDYCVKDMGTDDEYRRYLTVRYDSAKRRLMRLRDDESLEHAKVILNSWRIA
jgi:hypothetical protein